MERYPEKNREMGQALVEWAFVFPVFLLLVCGIIDFCWIGYQQLMFESTFQMTAWDFSLNIQDLSGKILSDVDFLTEAELLNYNTDSPAAVRIGTTYYTLGEGIRQHMLRGASGFLKEEELTVSNASAVFKIVSARETYLAGGNSILQQNYELRVGLEGDLAYRVSLLTPVSRVFMPSGEVVLEKKLVRQRTERVIVKRRVVVPL